MSPLSRVLLFRRYQVLLNSTLATSCPFASRLFHSVLQGQAEIRDNLIFFQVGPAGPGKGVWPATVADGEACQLMSPTWVAVDWVTNLYDTCEVAPAPPVDFPAKEEGGGVGGVPPRFSDVVV